MIHTFGMYMSSTAYGVGSHIKVIILYMQNLSKCQLKARNMFNGDYGPGLLASSNSLKSTGKVLPLNNDEIAQIGSGAFSIATRYEGRDSPFVLPRQEQAIYEVSIVNYHIEINSLHVCFTE